MYAVHSLTDECFFFLVLRDVIIYNGAYPATIEELLVSFFDVFCG